MTTTVRVASRRLVAAVSLLATLTPVSCSSSSGGSGGGGGGGGGGLGVDGSTKTDGGTGCAQVEKITCASGTAGVDFAAGLPAPGTGCVGATCNGECCGTTPYWTCGTLPNPNGTTANVCFAPGSVSCNNPEADTLRCATFSECTPYGCCNPGDACGQCDTNGNAVDPCQCAPKSMAAVCGTNTLCGSVDNCGTSVNCECENGYTCTAGKCVAPCEMCGRTLNALIQATENGSLAPSNVVACPGNSTTLINAVVTCGSNSCSASDNEWCIGDESLLAGLTYDSFEAVNFFGPGAGQGCGQCILGIVGNPSGCDDEFTACYAEGCVAVGGACMQDLDCCGGVVVADVSPSASCELPPNAYAGQLGTCTAM